MHPETRQYLDSIIRFCQTRGCRLTLSMSPAYTGTHQEMRKREQIVKQYQFIADSCHLPLFDYSADTSICRHPQYFEDPYHLFYPGARLFTRKIAADFNNITR